MKPPARAIVGNLVWSADRGVWAVWRVDPFPHANLSMAEKMAVHSRLRGLLVALRDEAMLLSVSERLDPWTVVERMVTGVDLDRRPAWVEVCEASANWLHQVPLHEQRYYLAAMLPTHGRWWQDAFRGAAADVHSTFGAGPRPIPVAERERREREALELQQRLAQHITLHPVSAGELCWLYNRALRREAGEPTLGVEWEPLERGVWADVAGADRARQRVQGVLAHLTDVVVKEGGDRDDEHRPRHRRYVRIDSGYDSSYQTVMALADMPHYFLFPNGGGEWLYHLDNAGFPLDWCVRLSSVGNADAQAKVRRKQRDLLGQIEQYDGEVSGAPPQLAEAIQAIEEERAQLGANPAESELHVTVLVSLAAASLPELEERAEVLASMFQPMDYGLARPTGGQEALLRALLPGTVTPQAARDYTQFMLARDLAAGSPYCRTDIGDPTGLLLGVSADGGNSTPVLFDPAYGPKVNASPSLAAVGRLGSGKSFFLKRICWDTVARGGQVVTIDRSRAGEYVRFAESMAGSAQVVHLEAGADVGMDPMRSFQGDQRSTITLGFLSLLAGCSAHSEEGAVLAEAVDEVTERPGARLDDVLDELERMAKDPEHPDAAARALARRLAHYRRSGLGQLAFGDRPPLSLDGDFIVFWAPNLMLPDRATLANADGGGGGGVLLPEQVLAQALLYLVAAVGRQVVFRDPGRFAAALYDEAWALLASPHGQSLVIEGVRDGRKHNGAIWLASQHPNDVAVSELSDLLGSRLVFDQARQAVPAALEFLGVGDSDAAAARLEGDLPTGQCLYRDVRGRLGAVQVLPPALARLDKPFDTAPISELAKTFLGGQLEEGDGGDVLPLSAGSDNGHQPVAQLPAAGDDLSAEHVTEERADQEASSEPLGVEAGDVLSVPGGDRTGDVLRDVSSARSRVRERRRSRLSQALAEDEG